MMSWEQAMFRAIARNRAYGYKAYRVGLYARPPGGHYWYAPIPVPAERAS